LSSQGQEDILETSTRYISESFNYDVVILLPGKENKLEAVSSFGTEIEFNEHEKGVATWAFEHSKEAGNSTETLSSSKWLHLPLKVRKGTLGVLSIATETNINKEQKHLIEAFTSVISLALSNSKM
jgi:two-component system sensor histidine kinase KdpD